MEGRPTGVLVHDGSGPIPTSLLEEAANDWHAHVCDSEEPIPAIQRSAPPWSDGRGDRLSPFEGGENGIVGTSALPEHLLKPTQSLRRLLRTLLSVRTQLLRDSEPERNSQYEKQFDRMKAQHAEVKKLLEPLVGDLAFAYRSLAPVELESFYKSIGHALPRAASIHLAVFNLIGLMLERYEWGSMDVGPSRWPSVGQYLSQIPPIDEVALIGLLEAEVWAATTRPNPVAVPASTAAGESTQDTRYLRPGDQIAYLPKEHREKTKVPQYQKAGAIRKWAINNGLIRDTKKKGTWTYVCEDEWIKAVAEYFKEPTEHHASQPAPVVTKIRAAARSVLGWKCLNTACGNKNEWPNNTSMEQCPSCHRKLEPVHRKSR